VEPDGGRRRTQREQPALPVPEADTDGRAARVAAGRPRRSRMNHILASRRWSPAPSRRAPAQTFPDTVRPCPESPGSVRHDGPRRPGVQANRPAGHRRELIGGGGIVGAGSALRRPRRGTRSACTRPFTMVPFRPNPPFDAPDRRRWRRSRPSPTSSSRHERLEHGAGPVAAAKAAGVAHLRLGRRRHRRTYAEVPLPPGSRCPRAT
jgi:hypothetical protein